MSAQRGYAWVMIASLRLAVITSALAVVALQLGCGDDAGGSGGSSIGGRAGSGGTPPPGGQGGVDWTNAGYPGEIPDVDQNVVDVSCGGSDDQPAIQAAIDDLLEAETPAQSMAVLALYLQGFLQVAAKADTFGPRWQRFLERLEKSRFFGRLSDQDL